MSVQAIEPGYHGEFKDAVSHFGGKQLINICWEKHTMMGWPMCVPLAPETPFQALIENVLPAIYGVHPDFAKIRWDEVLWSTKDGPFTPELDRSIADHGFKHKAQIRFRTPGLDGHLGAG